jgi:hypothetical protein
VRCKALRPLRAFAFSGFRFSLVLTFLVIGMITLLLAAVSSYWRAQANYKRRMSGWTPLELKQREGFLLRGWVNLSGKFWSLGAISGYSSSKATDKKRMSGWTPLEPKPLEGFFTSRLVKLIQKVRGK